MKHAMVSAVLLLASALAAQAETNWADRTGFGSDSPSFAASKAICRASSKAVVPPAEGAPAPPGCDAERLYYGIGQPADPAAARRCAMAQRSDHGREQRLFSGDVILTMIFANGRGAPRDLPAALALACTLDGAPAEMDGRVLHLAALRDHGPGDKPFDICDDITSGLSQGECAIHDSAVAAATRDAALAALTSALTPAQRQSFGPLHDAEEAFARARGDNETDLSGSGRAAFETEAIDGVRDQFLALVKGTGAGAAHSGSLAVEDAALNKTYRAVMAVADPQWGTPTKDGIKATQRLWLTYRDRLADFVRDWRGAAAADAAVASLTHQRTIMLREFAPDP